MESASASETDCPSPQNTFARGQGSREVLQSVLVAARILADNLDCVSVERRKVCHCMCLQPTVLGLPIPAFSDRSVGAEVFRSSTFGITTLPCAFASELVNTFSKSSNAPRSSSVGLLDKHELSRKSTLFACHAMSAAARHATCLETASVMSCLPAPQLTETGFRSALDACSVCVGSLEK